MRPRPWHSSTSANVESCHSFAVFSKCRTKYVTLFRLLKKNTVLCAEAFCEDIKADTPLSHHCPCQVPCSLSTASQMQGDHTWLSSALASPTSASCLGHTGQRQFHRASQHLIGSKREAKTHFLSTLYIIFFKVLTFNIYRQVENQQNQIKLQIQYVHRGVKREECSQMDGWDKIKD